MLKKKILFYRTNLSEDIKQKEYNDKWNLWKQREELLCNKAKQRLYDLLNFPGGWLVDNDDETVRILDEFEIGIYFI